VAEYYRLLDWQAASAAQAREREKENLRILGAEPGFAPYPNYKDNGLQLN
jgi:hypothetical protein